MEGLHGLPMDVATPTCDRLHQVNALSKIFKTNKMQMMPQPGAQLKVKLKTSKHFRGKELLQWFAV